MNGKGDKRRPGDEAKVRANWPLPERKTVAQWCEEFNVFAVGLMPTNRMTEAEFKAELVKVGYMHRTEEPKITLDGATQG